MRAVGERTRMSFFSIMCPRLKELDPVMYSRRHIIDRDLRYLGAACNHRIPSQDVDLDALINGAKAKSLSYLHQPKEEENLLLTKESVSHSTFGSSFSNLHSESKVSSSRKRASSPIQDCRPKNKNFSQVSQSLGYKFRQSLRPGGNLFHHGDSMNNEYDSDSTYFADTQYSHAIFDRNVHPVSHSTPSKPCSPKLDLSHGSLDAEEGLSCSQK